MGKAYTANLKAINNCKKTSFNKVVNPFHPAGINTSEILNTLIYPNPTHDFLYLPKQVVSYTLMDASGRVLLEGNVNCIDLSNKANGIYLLRIIINSGEKTFIKVVKN